MITFLNDDDSNDHTVNTQNTSHDDWNYWFHDQFWLENTHGADSDTGLGTTIGGSKVSENKGRCNTNVSEEVVVIVTHCLFVWNIWFNNYWSPSFNIGPIFLNINWTQKSDRFYLFLFSNSAVHLFTFLNLSLLFFLSFQNFHLILP